MIFSRSSMPRACITDAFASAMRAWFVRTSESTAVSLSFCVDILQREEARGAHLSEPTRRHVGGRCFEGLSGSYLFAEICAASRARRIAVRSASARFHSILRALKRFCRST